MKRVCFIECEEKELREDVKTLEYAITKLENRLDNMLKIQVLSQELLKDLRGNYNKNMSADKLLDKIANDMGSNVVTWTTVQEATEKNISFAMIIDSSKYLTEDEIKRIEENSNI